MSVFSDDERKRRQDKYDDLMKHGEYERARLMRGWYPESKSGSADSSAAPPQVIDPLAAISARRDDAATAVRVCGLIDQGTRDEILQLLQNFPPFTSIVDWPAGYRAQAADFRRLASKITSISRHPSVWVSSQVSHIEVAGKLKDLAQFLEETAATANKKEANKKR